jgi:hypothetical protein
LLSFRPRQSLQEGLRRTIEKDERFQSLLADLVF